ncbi:MAG: tetratricopeptide repeat protein [Fuerstiella sp.]
MITVLVALLAPISFAVDSVTRRSDNSRIRGKITSATVSEIVVKSASGKATTIPISDVRKVEFDKEPSGLIAARANERSGAFALALEKYTAIQKSYNKSDKRLVADLNFLIARTTAKLAATDPAKSAEALKLLSDFRAANPTNFRYLEATLLNSRLLGENGQAAEGQTLLAEVQQSNVKSYQLQAGVALGTLMLKSEDLPGALEAFTSVVKQSTGDQSAQGSLFEGLLGQATCLQKQSKHTEAVTVLDRIIAEAAESESATLASAWLRKGDSLQAEGKVKAALMAYLHVDVLYPGEAAQHSEALYHLAKLWGPAGHADRAAEASARLASQYPNSTWTKRN